MKVEQAIYGESRGGHGLRLGSSDLPIISALTSYLDLPDAAPLGVNWSPFVSGFPHGKYYILARTFADPAASRPGMVLSHAVIVPLEEVINISDLRPLFEMLLTEPIFPGVLEACEFLAIAKPLKPTPELVSLANALVTRGRGPVIRFGLQDFDELIASLWVHLWPEIRSKFSFRLSFGPQDIIDEITPAVICTPNALASRWSSYRVLSNDIQSPSLAAGILYGGMDRSSVMELTQQVGAKIYQFSELPLLQRLYEIDKNPDPQFDECVSALRIIEKLSPYPAPGLDYKNVFTHRLVLRLPHASLQDILLLRNLGTAGLPDATRIWTSLKDWATANSLVASEDIGMLSVLSDALCATAAIEPWRLSIINGLISGSHASPEILASAFWRWAKLGPKVIAQLAEYLPIEGEFEYQIVKAVPDVLDLETGNVVMAIAHSKNWLKLHGTAASACLEPLDAIMRQLSIDTRATELEGLRAALRRTGPRETIELALARTNETRLLHLAAERIADNPSLLGTLSFTSIHVQDLWFYALSINSEAWKGPNDPYGAFSVVLKKLIQNSEVNLQLIEALSFTPLADLSKYIKNADVWSYLPEPARGNCLRATAIGWLHNALEGNINHPDNLLERAILTNEKLALVLQSDNPDIGNILRVIKYLPNLEEFRVLRWLNENALTKPLQSADSEELGRIIQNQSWHQIVETLIKLTKQGRGDLKPALIQCYSMVGLFWRLVLGLPNVSYSEKWALLEELAVELYPNGPDEQALWDRAGGKDADLKVNGSGRNRWHDAISYLQRGRGPYVSALFKEMQSDYPQNDKLRALREIRYF
ncbi:hypothetical protein BF17_04465 [Yersinia similis]|uniref:Effector-associated domain-containing protein n=1 Tax=Yersinia similis TaxID=367190 RepID=A0ABM5Q3N6_9GAMM|nr:effector-associated domain EAD1-containing protein [Yersinia similis]AHK21923.1 hypothetical protein BF17_04465 [Yersinia similis]CFQ68625.1 Uncharacterised protein [Yersinia similis]